MAGVLKREEDGRSCVGRGEGRPDSRCLRDHEFYSALPEGFREPLKGFEPRDNIRHLKGIMMAIQGGVRLKFKHCIHNHVKEDA